MSIRRSRKGTPRSRQASCPTQVGHEALGRTHRLPDHRRLEEASPGQASPDLLLARRIDRGIGMVSKHIHHDDSAELLFEPRHELEEPAGRHDVEPEQPDLLLLDDASPPPHLLFRVVDETLEPLRPLRVTGPEHLRHSETHRATEAVAVGTRNRPSKLVVLLPEEVLLIPLIDDFLESVHVQPGAGRLLQEAPHLLDLVGKVVDAPLVVEVGRVGAKHGNVAPRFAVLDHLVKHRHAVAREDEADDRRGNRHQILLDVVDAHADRGAELSPEPHSRGLVDLLGQPLGRNRHEGSLVEHEPRNLHGLRHLRGGAVVVVHEGPALFMGADDPIASVADELGQLSGDLDLRLLARL